MPLFHQVNDMYSLSSEMVVTSGYLDATLVSESYVVNCPAVTTRWAINKSKQHNV